MKQYELKMRAATDEELTFHELVKLNKRISWLTIVVMLIAVLLIVAVFVALSLRDNQDDSKCRSIGGVPYRSACYFMGSKVNVKDYIKRWQNGQEI